jgi:succinate-acetate transporter protein
MAVGNTFGATALSSYGGFWIAFAMVLTPGGFEIEKNLGGAGAKFYDSMGLFLMVSCCLLSCKKFFPLTML